MKSIMQRTAALAMVFFLLLGTICSNMPITTVYGETGNTNELSALDAGIAEEGEDGSIETPPTTEAPSVTPPATISNIYFSPNSVTLTVGENKQLTVMQEPSNAASEAITYTTSNNSVATVSSSGQIAGVKAGTATITATSTSGATDTCSVTVQEVPKVTRIYFSQSSATIKVNESKQLTVVQEPSNAVAETITYTSSNTTVVAVSLSGVVIGAKAGTATITAKSYSGYTASCTVTVQEDSTKVSNIYFNPSSVTVTVGGSRQLTVVQEPTTAAKESITYTTSNSSIATVSSSGIVKGIKAGTATITAKSYSGLTNTCRITVNAASKITRIYFSPSTVTLTVGGTSQLTVKQEPSTETAETITYTSSNNSIVTVNSTGKITAVKAGTATITAKSYSGLTNTCQITVKEASKITSIYFSPSSVTLTVDETKQLKVIQEPTSETAEILTYTTSNSNVVTVNSSGKITALKAGSAKITAKSASGYTASCQITVKAKIQLNKTKLSVGYGQSAKLKMTGTTDNVTWKTSNKKIVTVQNGKVTGVEVGTAKVYATVGNKTYTCAVAVKKPTINIRQKSLKVGYKVKLKVNNNGKKVKWTSSDSKIASVSQAGNVTAKKSGKTTITGTIGSKYTVKCAITVLRQEPKYSIAITSATNSYCTLILLKVKNRGNQPLMILSKGANLSDYHYYSYDRSLYLVNGSSYNKISSVTIRPGKTTSVYFRVKGSATWYDYLSKVYYYMKYDGKSYKCSSSYYFGHYYDI